MYSIKNFKDGTGIYQWAVIAPDNTVYSNNLMPQNDAMVLTNALNKALSLKNSLDVIAKTENQTLIIKEDLSFGYDVIDTATGKTVPTGFGFKTFEEAETYINNQRPIVKSENILEEANRLIYGDRAKAYGPVNKSFERIAKLWEVILETKITAEQVGLCMIALKMSRQISKAGRDNIVDIAGYAGCIAKMDEEKTAV